MKDIESLFSVGNKYDDWATKQDGYIIEWNNDLGLTLYAFLNGVSKDELAEFDVSQTVRVRYTIIDDVCYFLFKFGEMPWANCPFSPSIYTFIGKHCNFPSELKKNNGISLSLLLIDSSTGELLKIRLIGLAYEFSNKWLDWARGVVNKDLPLERYNKKIDGVYMKYSSIELAKKALKEKNEYILKV